MRVRHSLLSWQRSLRSGFKVYKLFTVLQMEIPCNYQALLHIGDDSKSIALWDLSHTVLLFKNLRQGTRVFSPAKSLGKAKAQGGNVEEGGNLVINWFGMLGWKVGTWASLLSEILVFIKLLATYIFVYLSSLLTLPNAFSSLATHEGDSELFHISPLYLPIGWKDICSTMASFPFLWALGMSTFGREASPHSQVKCPSLLNRTRTHTQSILSEGVVLPLSH